MMADVMDPSEAPRGESGFWTAERERTVAHMWDEGFAAADIARAMSASGRSVSVQAIEARIRVLQTNVRLATNFWTPERNAKLRELWTRQPVVTLREMRRELGGERTVQAISQQAHKLGLEPRSFHREPRHSPRRPDASERSVGVRSPFVGESPLKAVQRPARRPAPPLETPCPFYLGHGEVCGVMVNRRPDPHGNRPSQYCPGHRSDVMPLSRGSLGTPATYAKGVKYG